MAARPPELSRRQINVVFGTILLGLLLAALDQTIVATALPTIVGDLGGAGHLSWVVTAYLLAETIAAAVVGKFGDLFGRKRIFQLSAVVFVIGSLLCGAAQDMLWLVTMRAVQGIGAGGILVTATALIADVRTATGRDATRWTPLWPGWPTGWPTTSPTATRSGGAHRP
jgi:MFS family permease